VLYSFSPGLEFLDLARLVAGEHDDVDAASAQCSRRFDRPPLTRKCPSWIVAHSQPQPLPRSMRRAYLVHIAPINGIRNCCQAGLGRANNICRRAPNNSFRPNLVVPRPASDSPKQSFTKLGRRLQSAQRGNLSLYDAVSDLSQ
jgi:hypothetical protein